MVAVCAARVGAVPVHLFFDWSAGMPASVPRARIQAVWTAGAADGGIPAAVQAEAGPDGVILDLRDGVWKVDAFAPGYWSQGVQIAIDRQAAPSAHIVFWPAASLRGELNTADGDTLPDVLEVRLSAASDVEDDPAASQGAASRPEPSPSHAELECRIDKGVWTCLGPAGLFDVQLEAASYTPRYEWGVRLKAAESNDLGRTDLRRTASVFGRATRKNSSNPPGPCRATLQEDVQRRGGPGSDAESTPAGNTNLSVPLSQRGFFQIVGVQPGRQVLSVECEGASGLRELVVQADTETRIDPPMQLEELTLDIGITPRTDPAGQPWQLSVDATAPRLRQIAEKANTSPEGHWTRHGLMAGGYRVAVNSSDGTLWPQQFIELAEGSKPLSLRLAFVRVAGRVLLGTEPVHARLVFLNEAEGEPVTLSSDDAGHFHGLLPVEPDAQGTSWIVEAHGAQPLGNRRLTGVNVPWVAAGATARLELALPMIAVRGTVVSEQGQPQRDVQVKLEDSSKTRTFTATDDAGGFEIPELPPGRYTAVAESGDGVSELTPLEVVDGTESELKLVLSPSTRVPFYVVSTDGPVDGAAVQVWIAPGVPNSFTHTDRDGRFEVKLPRGTSEVGLTIGAPGYALKLIRLPVPAESNQPSDANTITLRAIGGTLELDLKPPGHAVDSSNTPSSPSTPYLVHNGAVEFAGRLATWGTDRASGDGSGVVETIEPGDYALCLVAGPAELTKPLWTGALPPDRCHAGKVEQGRTLTLPPK